MKKLLLITLLAFIPLYGANAALFTTNLSAGNTGAILFTNAATINQITVVNATTTNDTIRIYDANYPTLLWTNSTLITNTTSYITNNVAQVYTNFSGVLTTNNYTNALITLNTTNGPTTNSFPLLFAVGATASNTTTYTPLSPTAVSYGVVVTNTTPVTITINYNSTK